MTTNIALLPAVTADLTSDPADFLRTYLPHLCPAELTVLQRFSFEQYQRHHAEPLPHRTGRRLAIAAPRGAGKSLLHARLFPLMDLMSGRERHQVILCGTMDESKKHIAAITHELRTNSALHTAFFGGRPPRLKANTRSIELGNCRIEAFGCLSEMRGVSHGEYRPTGIILDDVEQSTAHWKPGRRAQFRTWYDEVVENLGDTYTHITVVGTVVHNDSLLSSLLERPGFRSEKFEPEAAEGKPVSIAPRPTTSSVGRMSPSAWVGNRQAPTTSASRLRGAGASPACLADAAWAWTINKPQILRRISPKRSSVGRISLSAWVGNRRAHTTPAPPATRWSHRQAKATTGRAPPTAIRQT